MPKLGILSNAGRCRLWGFTGGEYIASIVCIQLNLIVVGIAGRIFGIQFKY